MCDRSSPSKPARPLLFTPLMRWRTGLLLLVCPALLTTGCVQTETTPVVYRLPLEGNSRGAAAAQTCAAACRVANERKSEAGFFACIGTCPDVQVIRDAECGGAPEETPPAALCYTRLVKEEVPNPAVANFFGELLGDLIEGAIEVGVNAAVMPHHEGGSEHEAHGGGRERSAHAPSSHSSRSSVPAPKRIAARHHSS